MSRYNFAVGAKFLLDVMEHIINSATHDEVVVELTKYKQFKTYKKKELYNEWFEEKLIFEDKGVRALYAKSDINNLSAERKGRNLYKIKGTRSDC